MLARRDGRERWREVQCLGDIPPGRIGHTVTVNDEGVAYLWGGVNENLERGSKYLDDFYRYNFARKEWRQVELKQERPCGRAFHSAVMYNGCMSVFGGCNGHGRFNQIFSINGETGVCQSVESSGALPSTRYCHSAVVHSGQMIVFGGKCGGRNSNKRLADMYAFDFASGDWHIIEATGDLPSSRSAHTAVVYFNKMLMFGGRNADGKCCEDLYEFCFDTSEWRRIEHEQGNQFFMRARHSIVVHNDKLITFAGWNGKKKLNDLFQYNLDSHTFQLVHDSDENDPRLPCRRECHTSVVIANTMILFGGRFRGLFMNDNCEFQLDVLSLKELCRSFIIQTPQIDYEDTKYGLPDQLINYIKLYARRGLSWSQKQADGKKPSLRSPPLKRRVV
eukprot:NODE_2235_length_1241_cov_27.730700_g2124_i0.p1 GENE.NODE_2235_length_1241_cov_27.730700_g2124_i0~~NODE_2235_length_1241_cov_27.730700_g2124_i0.p1  ORF type:complete len:391 (-),score=69.70 NODE_2235_length_1241_cov_27.730700_g2124_i0:10-1182(-)